jgi:AraC-like DNA-binding protein
MRSGKPSLEGIDPGHGSSFKLRKYTELTSSRTCWHFHPEYELVYISRGSGRRHIGEHISQYNDGDLLLLGPNLPHLGFTHELKEPHEQVVLQMRADFWGPSGLQMPECWPIRTLLERAVGGIAFGSLTRQRVGDRLLQMFGQRPMERLISLLQILNELSEATDYELLNAHRIAWEVNAQDQQRMRLIVERVEHSFQRVIPLEEMADLCSMTAPAFCRFFKKMTGETFTTFVNAFRLAYARRLLTETDLTIAAISFDAGFNNLSHFNHLFRQANGCSPSDFRKQMKIITAME